MAKVGTTSGSSNITKRCLRVYPSSPAHSCTAYNAAAAAAVTAAAVVIQAPEVGILTGLPPTMWPASMVVLALADGAADATHQSGSTEESCCLSGERERGQEERQPAASMVLFLCGFVVRRTRPRICPVWEASDKKDILAPTQASTRSVTKVLGNH
jgi:hypothetical protein